MITSVINYIKCCTISYNKQRTPANNDQYNDNDTDNNATTNNTTNTTNINVTTNTTTNNTTDSTTNTTTDTTTYITCCITNYKTQRPPGRSSSLSGTTADNLWLSTKNSPTEEVSQLQKSESETDRSK